MSLKGISTQISDPKLLRVFRKVENQLEKRTPLASFEYVDVTFNANANSDTVITHTLEPDNPEDIDYEVVRWNFSSAPATVPVVYRDSSATRKTWNEGYIVLRCNVASASATLRLSVRNV